MSTHPPRPLAEMRAAAEVLVAELGKFCARIEIAGSIRRQRPECSDIELVCVPKIEMRREGLFDQVPHNLLDEHIAELLDEGWMSHRLDSAGRQSCGERAKRLTVMAYDVALDLFSVLPPAQFGVIFLIRTGPAEYSRRLITSMAAGGDMPMDCRVAEGALWRRGAIVETPEEADVFHALGLEYVAPEDRGSHLQRKEIEA